MYLESLEISGFKSFSKKTELEFATPITAIVGPNGSGKSNVAEAFRFVLGEQSIKSMRGRRGEDLIWGGTTQVARANRASVKITLHNKERVFPLDFDSISVERIVHRDGENEYMLNGSRVRLKDVQEILAAANIGPTGHHIISQGEADRILSASSKERREMIEDALGLKIYQYKKAESEKKMARAKENMEQVESLRREVAPHMRFLERQVKKIEKSIALQAELTIFYKEYLKREELYINHHTERLDEAEKAPQEELSKLRVELERVKEVLNKDTKEESKNVLVSLEEKLSATRVKKESVMRESGRIEGLLSYMERSLRESKEKEADTQKAIPFAEVKRVIESVVGMATEASHDADVLRRSIEKITHALRSFLHDVSNQDEASSGIEKIGEELSELTKEKSKIDVVLTEIAEEEKILDAEYDAQKSALEAENTENRAAEREVFHIMGRQRELTEVLNAHHRNRQELLRDREDFKREIQEAVVLIGSAVREYREIETDKDGVPIILEEIVREDRAVQIERRRALEKMKIRLEELGGGGGDEVMKEYKEVVERDEFLKNEIDDLKQSVEKLEVLIADLTDELNTQFISGIEKIGAEFNRFFVLMFGGGAASLVRIKPKVKKKKEDFEDIFSSEEGVEEEITEEGIDIDVQLPNKRVKGLEMLSGGERALTSIALIFAMSQVNPPLFVILDETDAALDEANSRRYGDMIESLAEKSQLILITHNRETMGRAGVLYGVTMGGDGVSKLLSVKFEEAVKVAK